VTYIMHLATERARSSLLVLIRERLEAFPLAILLLLARVAVGATFFKSGMNKIASWEFTVQLFADEYRVPVLPPEIAAYLATAVELTCPVFLVLGLATRLATLPLLVTTAVIQLFVYPLNWPEHLIWATLLALLLTRGPGALALDRWVEPWAAGGGRQRR
jgi:putative oxidoreductase